MIKRKIEYWENTGETLEPIAITFAIVALCFVVSEVLRIIL